MMCSLCFSSIDWKNTAEVLAAAVGLYTLIKGTLEYVKQGALKRTELFLQMRDRHAKFFYLFNLFDHQETAEEVEALRSLPYEEKLAFLDFYEQLALMAESGLIRKSVAHYMFGNYAIECWKSDAFWSGLNREELYWRLFRNFVESMQEEEKSFLQQKFKSNKYQL